LIFGVAAFFGPRFFGAGFPASSSGSALSLAFLRLRGWGFAFAALSESSSSLAFSPASVVPASFFNFL